MYQATVNSGDQAAVQAMPGSYIDQEDAGKMRNYRVSRRAARPRSELSWAGAMTRRPFLRPALAWS